jgi:hypothetical protein
MAIIGTLPNNIQNGQAVDANPVMADFNFIVNQVNANANPIGTLTAPSGTRTAFHQAAAPLGWTQDTSITDHTIQVVGVAGGLVSGTNGYSTMFNAAWTSDGHALTTAELAVHAHTIPDPGHTHTVNDPTHSHGYIISTNSAFGVAARAVAGDGSAGNTAQTNAAATGVSLAPALTGITATTNSGSGAAHTHTKQFNAKFIQMIIGVKT